MTLIVLRSVSHIVWAPELSFCRVRTARRKKQWNSAQTSLSPPKAKRNLISKLPPSWIGYWWPWQYRLTVEYYIPDHEYLSAYCFRGKFVYPHHAIDHHSRIRCWLHGGNPSNTSRNAQIRLISQNYSRDWEVPHVRRWNQKKLFRSWSMAMSISEVLLIPLQWGLYEMPW